MPTLEFVLPEGSPDPCPNACGGLTEDEAGGPCKACWAKVGRDDDERPGCTLRPGQLGTCYCTGRPGCQSPRPNDDDHCHHCGETDCDGDSCQDDLQETYPGSGIYE